VDEDPEAAPIEVQPKAKVSVPTDIPKAASEKEQYFVQVGVFSDLNNVKQLQSKLSSLGYKSSTEKITTPKGEKIRLRSQVFSSRNEAAIALQNIKASGLTGMVVSQ
jgi:DedD protein